MPAMAIHVLAGGIALPVVIPDVGIARIIIFGNDRSHVIDVHVVLVNDLWLPYVPATLASPG